MGRALTTLLAAALAAGAVGCGQERQGAVSGESPADWIPVSDVPLSPRAGALGAWTGSETLLLGGSDARPCPAGADCEPPDVPPLRDGAAFDPSTRTWRAIADAPQGFSDAEGLVLGGVAYVWASGYEGRPSASPAFLAYDIERDEWEELPMPSGNPYRSIAAAGDKLIAFSTSDEVHVVPDLVFDPATKAWSPLPDDPLPPSFDRSMAWDGEELVLFAKRLLSQPNGRDPSLALAAALDLKSGQWRRLPDSETLDQYATTARWFESDGVLVNPAPGGSDGGEVNGWGRTYPYGGVLDAGAGEWSSLPEPPAGASSSPGAYGAGLMDSDEAHYFATQGWILDATTDRWIEIPPLEPVAASSGTTVTRAGKDMLVFGGALYHDEGGEGELSSQAWTWSPR